ncbi:MAG: YggS family pyridoxal phosphate-dependent enzyme [Candidatus Marinimicrobia bacterium]|nr:YggS family pyridoxal phosphate-dependent enzyme [Candidatus Neomarinimicrobiota bacterium]
MSLTDTLSEIQQRISETSKLVGGSQSVTIVAVTKTHPAIFIENIFNAGIVNIGENRVQEAQGKFPQLPKLPGLTKRMIGHLQSNKVNKTLDLFDTIDSVDSLKLAKRISNRAKLLEKNTPVLLEVNTSGEAAKSGFDPTNLQDMLACLEEENITVGGLMTVGPLTSVENEIREAFSSLRNLLNELNRQRPSNHPQMSELSMGMSMDYQLAVEEGSTMIRLGTALFGFRKQENLSRET